MAGHIEISTTMITMPLDEAYSFFTRLLPIRMSNETGGYGPVIACTHKLVDYDDEYDSYYDPYDDDDSVKVKQKDVIAIFMRLDDPGKEIAKIVFTEYNEGPLDVCLLSGEDYQVEHERYLARMVDFFEDLCTKLYDKAHEIKQRTQAEGTKSPPATQAFQWPPPDQRLLTPSPTDLHTSMHTFSEVFPTFIKTDFPDISSEVTYHETFWQYFLSFKGKHIIELRIFNTNRHGWIRLQMLQVDRPEWFTTVANVMDIYNFYLDFWSRCYCWAHMTFNAPVATPNDEAEETTTLEHTLSNHAQNSKNPKNDNNDKLNNSGPVETQIEPAPDGTRKIQSGTIEKLRSVV